MIRFFAKAAYLGSMALLCLLVLIPACSGGDEEEDDEDDDGDDDDDTGTGTTEMYWMPVAGGTFEMGCSAGDTECEGDENPIHTVTIPSFEMSAIEITQEMFMDVMDDNPSKYDDCPDCPVENVPWLYAGMFCQAVDARLPTEAEWEYAARAGTTTKYSCGDDDACLDNAAWYSANSDGIPRKVGHKDPNAFGLYDMMGNVREWVNDSYDADYYTISPQQDPPGPSEGLGHILRAAPRRVLLFICAFPTDSGFRISWTSISSVSAAPATRNNNSECGSQVPGLYKCVWHSAAIAATKCGCKTFLHTRGSCFAAKRRFAE